VDGGEDIESLYRRYFPLVREKCRRMLADAEEATDVAQETFIRFWRARPENLEPNQVTAWIYKTSTHLAVDRIRRRRPREPLNLESSTAYPVADAAATVDLRRLLAQVARYVPRRELEVAVLHRADGMDQNEIAEVTRLSARTIRRLLTRFDERVTQLLKEDA